MTVPPDEIELAAAFSPVDRDRWREMVKGVLRRSGAAAEDIPLDAIEDLLTRESYDGVPIAALYTRDDAPPGRPGLAPYVREVRPDGEGIAGWDVRQLHAHPDPAVTREAILADLENGATSIWLRLGDAGPPVGALAETLRGVMLDLAPVALEAGTQTAQAADAFLSLVAERGNAADASGTLGADPLGLAARTGTPGSLDEAAALAVRCAREFPKLRAVVADGTPFHDAGGSDAEELGAAVAAGVAYLRALTGAGLSVDEAFGQIEFRLAVNADQFASIAKLRAARRLWARVAEVSGAADGTSARIHAVTSSAMMTRRDPWVNMLRTTLAAFAAGTGGADAVTVQPFDARLGLPDGFARRVARNTQTLLLEESSLARVVDPAGGSWYVESLTEGLANAAWDWFTEIERAGGLAAALESGLVADRVAATWARRRKDIARRKAPLTGVSEFPNLAETLPEREAAPEGPGAHSHFTSRARLPVVTYAQDFEALRDRSDAHAEAAGARPRVFLATLGPIAVHTARASFAANLFQAGGIETVTGPPEEFAASGTAVACLCSSDTVYEERAAEAARVLRRAGAIKVWLAGKGTYEGVDAGVYAGCDAIAVLETALRDLGVNE
ncbi:methylmalonyl-CoA mutase family protein [Actinomadura sp. 3N508]|uniref:methylmalonyl-CoA mutase family protein n=1 Tax=Actinomadura sp. 3N508 TaxID=3375153 RepID=UPI0037B06ADB